MKSDPLDRDDTPLLRQSDLDDLYQIVAALRVKIGEIEGRLNKLDGGGPTLDTEPEL